MSQVKERHEIEEAYCWDLSPLFPSNEAWEEGFSRLRETLPALKRFRGKLHEKDELLAFFRESHETDLLSERLFVYAKMKRDLDNSDAQSVSMLDRVMSFLTQAEAEIAFVTPELTALPDDTLLSWSREEAFADHAIALSEIVRQKKHILSEKEERLLALTGEMAQSMDNTFTMLTDVDLTFTPITMPDGTKTELSHGRYGLFLESRDRDLRKQAYESMYGAIRGHINTLASLYSANVKKDVFYARVRGYAGARAAALFGGNIPESVYDGLIEAVHGAFPALHRYIARRKEILGVDELKMYDLYVPLTELDEKEYTYADAQALALEALAPLGEEYSHLLKRAFNERWIDVYETKGKTSGAYSWGAYGAHPYMLLNYQNRLDDVFTLVHEAGHSMHTFFSDRALPYEKAQYRIFVAEVASTVNEVLLLQYLLGKTGDKRERAYLLNHLLDQFRTTVFRQTMFAEFEWKAHKIAEENEALTVDALNGLYADLNRAYYSETVDTDEWIATEWARIPHFYNAFYVYQYATGFSAAVNIADRILKEGKPAIEAYLRFLSSGGSDFPVELLKIAGVDLSTPLAIRDALTVFERTLAQWEECLQ